MATIPFYLFGINLIENNLFIIGLYLCFFWHLSLSGESTEYYLADLITRSCQTCFQVGPGANYDYMFSLLLPFPLFVGVLLNCWGCIDSFFFISLLCGDEHWLKFYPQRHH